MQLPDANFAPRPILGGSAESETGSASGTPHPWRRPSGRVVVVLPAYNEAENLGRLLERLDESLTDAGLAYRVLVVDDGSTDDTRQVAERYRPVLPLELVIHEHNQGLGATIRDGLRAAAASCADKDVIVAMDADDTHTPGLIHTMLRLIQEGNDVVIASRFQPGADVRGVPWSRRVLSRGASWLLRLVFPTRGVRDFTCGYRAYRGATLRAAFARYGDELIAEDGFACMVDILLKLREMQVVFREAPLILRYDQKKGHTKMRVGQTIRRTLGLIWRRRWG